MPYGYGASQKSYKKAVEQRERQNVREQARQPVVQKSRQPGLAGSTSAKTMAPALKANRLEKEFKTASDDRKEQIVDELKDTRSELNKLNREQAILDLRKAAAGPGVPGLVQRDSSGNIITDSSGNPIMTTRGKEVFDETRGKFRPGSEALRQASPELYKKMYPMSSFAMEGLPSLLPGVGTLTRLLKGATGTGTDIIGQAGKAVAPAVRGIGELFGLNKIPGAIGNIFNKWNFGLPGSNRVSTAIPAGDGGGGGGGIDRGIVDAAQSVVDQQSPYGGWIGRDESKMYTADFIDNDGDGIDDRWQTGPGMPSQNPFQGNKMADAWNQSFQVGNMPPHIMPPMMGYSPITTDIAASQAAGYDIPLGGQPANMEDWYKNLGIMNLANRRVG